MNLADREIRTERLLLRRYREEDLLHSHLFAVLADESSSRP
jgi:hypothetical protein